MTFCIFNTGLNFFAPYAKLNMVNVIFNQGHQICLIIILVNRDNMMNDPAVLRLLASANSGELRYTRTTAA